MVNRDLNLLFGIMAVLLKRVTPEQLVEAAAWWASDPTASLAERMVAMGVLDDRDRAFLDEVVARAVASHGGDASATLSSFGGEKQVAESFRDSITPIKSNEARTIRQSVQSVPASDFDLESVPAVREASGRYAQVSEYGRGGMGRVLLVQDAFLNRQVALKELLPDLKGRETPLTPGGFHRELLSRFLQEARITGQLEHPSIVPVYELGRRDDDTLYYTMKLVRGRTLRDAISAARSLRERLALLPHVIDLCQALAYAHSQRVIHRDIKPANIMVGEFGETVVLDWGLAKSLDKEDAHAHGLAETMRLLHAGEHAEAAATAYGEVIGTPAYMSPEQALGQIESIDARSDIYALGAMLYELLTGRAPFLGDSVVDVLRKVVEKDPESIESTEPDAPPELAAIAMRAMAKDPAQRYASAKDMADDLTAFQSGALVGAHAYSPWDHLKRFARQNKGVLTTAATAAIVVMAIAVGAYFRMQGERDRALTAEANLGLVVDFQSRMLSEVNAEEMGAALRDDLLAAYAAMVARLGLSEADAHERVHQAESQFATLDFTGSAVKILDRQFLARALSAAEADYEDQPLVQARLLQTVALARANMGIHDGTTDLQYRVIAILEAHRGSDAASTHEARANLGLVLWLLGEPDEGIAHLEAAITALQRHWPEEDSRLLGYRYVVAQLKREEPLRFTAGADGAGSFEELLAKVSTFTVLSGKDQGEEWAMAAAALIEQSIHMMAANGIAAGAELESLLPTLRTGAWVDTTEAQRDDIVEVVSWIITQLPDTSPFTLGSTLIVLANEFLAFDDVDGAVDLFRRSHHWHRGRYGSNHQRTLGALVELGKAQEINGNIAEAKQHYREAHEGYRTNSGPESTAARNALNSLLRALIASGEWPEAEAYALEDFDTHLRTNGPDHATTRNACNRLIDLYEAWNETEPGSGHDAKAAQWREHLESPSSLQATDDA